MLDRQWPVKLLEKLKFHWVSLGKTFEISVNIIALLYIGLLDQPVLMEGKRKRKAVKQFNMEVTAPKKRAATKYVGSGTKLQDIPSGSVYNCLPEESNCECSVDLSLLYVAM